MRTFDNYRRAFVLDLTLEKENALRVDHPRTVKDHCEILVKKIPLTFFRARLDRKAVLSQFS
ncbi:MAG: hypothetical protein ACLFTS_02480 [Candidatus Paceibacterota bacterium]